MKSTRKPSSLRILWLTVALLLSLLAGAVGDASAA